MDIHQQLEASHARRMSAEARFLDRIEKREQAAARMIGDLCRDGRTIHYVWPRGGRYREGAFADLTGFLLRNNYA